MGIRVSGVIYIQVYGFLASRSADIKYLFFLSFFFFSFLFVSFFFFFRYVGIQTRVKHCICVIIVSNLTKKNCSLLTQFLTICVVYTLIVFPEFNRPNMIYIPFTTLPVNIGICSQVLRTAESLNFFFKSKIKSICVDNKCCSFCN